MGDQKQTMGMEWVLLNWLSAVQIGNHWTGDLRQFTNMKLNTVDVHNADKLDVLYSIRSYIFQYEILYGRGESGFFFFAIQTRCAIQRILCV